MAEIFLLVGGRKYGGWKSVRVTRSIESIAGSFDLEVNDRWSGQGDAWPIAPEDRCRVEVGGHVVIDGYIDKRGASLSGQVRSLSFSGRDKAAVLVDVSALLASWTFRNTSVLDIARIVAEPFGINVTVQDGLILPPAQRKITVSPGDKAYDVIERAARAAGVLVVSDGAGGLHITRSGKARATPLVEGQNILSATFDYDATDRFRVYLVRAQTPGTDQASGPATKIRAEATDEGVRRGDRVLIVRPDHGMTTEHARRRADWEARIRAAKAATVSVNVRGWLQPSGELWPLNALTYVKAPSLGLDGDHLISRADFTIGNEGELTTLHVVRPDAFEPEPRAIVKKKRNEPGLLTDLSAEGKRLAQGITDLLKKL